MTMITYYVIPANVYYVQSAKEIKSWVKTDVVDPTVPTVIYFDESKKVKEN